MLLKLKQLLFILISFTIIILPQTSVFAEGKLVKIVDFLGAEHKDEKCTLRVSKLTENHIISLQSLVYIAEGKIDENGNIEFSFNFNSKSGIYIYSIKCEDGNEKTGEFNFITEYDNSINNEAYYLLDDDFNMLKANQEDELEVSGWDIIENGGYLTYNGSTTFLLNDTSETSRLSLRRRFEAQSDTNMTLEFRFYQNNYQNNCNFQLKNGDNIVGVNLSTLEGKLYAGDGSDRRILINYTEKTEYAIRVEANLTTQKYDIYINGVKSASDVLFTTNCVSIDNFIVSTGKTSMGSVNFRPVRISRGYFVNEKFIASSVGTMQSGYWQSNVDGGTLKIISKNSAPSPDLLSLEMADTSSLKNVKISKILNNITDNIIWEFKALFPSGVNNFTATLSNQITLKMISNKLYIVNNNNENIFVSNLKTNLWYTFRVETENNLARVVLNGKDVLDYITIKNSEIQLSEISYFTDNQSVDTVWLDDIQLMRKIPLYEDYVEKPVMPKTDDVLVGIQTCDLWREGKHFGWDKINRDNLRKPYLGFYDDGSPEVKDWETKYMVEHGIDFELLCWYRPPSGTNTQIKDPRNGSSLHNGYFNSKYKNNIKFAIGWENGSTASSNPTDFQTNIVPFWMEYYFKDSNYLKIDNKPVLGIYNLTAFEESFGALTATQIEFLNQACINEGFAGVCMLGVTGSTDDATLQKFATYNFDAVYCYSWGYTSDSSSYQMSKMQAQKNKNIIPIIPTLGMGRDDSVWNRQSGGFMSPNDFNKFAKWAKDEFMPSIPQNQLGNKMVLLDNWNEYGEGHFLMPTPLAGFSYLEALGSVFSQNQHVDLIPTENQLKRLGRLYPQDRTVMAIQKTSKPPILPIVKKSWYFTSGLEGFTGGSHITNLIASNGMIQGNSTGSDPMIYSPNNLNVDISNIKYIKVRMKTTSTVASAKFYFIRTTDTNYSEQMALSWVVQPQDGNYVDCYVPIYKNANWNGVLKQLRLDPMEEIGTFYIDSIELLESIENVSYNQISNGSAEGNVLPISSNIGTTSWEFYENNHSFVENYTNVNEKTKFPILLNGNTDYIASLYIKSDKPSKMDIYIAYNNNGNEILIPLELNANIYDNSWSFIGKSFKTPDNIGMKNGYLVMKPYDINTNYYIDDVKLCEYNTSKLTLTDIKFTNDINRELYKLEEYKINCTFTLKNSSNSPQSVMPYIFVLSENKLISLKNLGSELTLLPNQVETFSISIDSKNTDTLKFLMFDSSLKPLYLPCILKN